MAEHPIGTGFTAVIAIVAGLLCCFLPLVLLGGAGGIFTLLGAAQVPLILAAVVVAGFVTVVLVLRHRMTQHPRSSSTDNGTAPVDECCAPAREPGLPHSPDHSSIGERSTGHRPGGR